MFGFVYEWTNLINGKKYIGSHIGDIDDGYVGSGVVLLKAIEKYGIKNFSRVILTSGDYNTRQDLFEQEQLWLDATNAANNPLFYNVSAVAGGGDTKAGWSEERKQEFSNHIASVWAARTDDERQQIIDKREQTISQIPGWRDQVNEKMRDTYAKMSPEALSSRAQKSVAKFNSERRSECVKRGKSLIPFEQRQESARKAVQNTTPEARQRAVTKTKLAIQSWSAERRQLFKEKASNAHKGQLVGGKNGRAKSVCADGTIYSTLKEAMAALNISEGTLHRRIKSSKFPEYYFIQQTE
jgi:group I intron endonuclease